MKLVHLFKYYWPDNGGGIAAAMDMVIHAFNEYAINEIESSQEIVCCWQQSGKEYKLNQYNGIEVHRCKSLFEFASTQVSPQFIKVVNRETRDADIVIYNFPYPFVDLAILFSRVHGKLVVWWHSDFNTIKGKFLTKLYAPLVVNTLKRADAIIVSANGNIYGSETLIPFKDKCYVIPFAISEDVARAGLEYYNDRTNIDRTNDKIHILFIGRFVWYKGINYLLEAYKKFDQDKYELTLIGNGPLFDQMRTYAAEIGLKNVNFVGSVSNEEKYKKYKWIKWCDYLVLPSVSKAESFGIVQIEAMAFGKPVINTKLPSGVPDVCPNGVAGITVNPGDTDELYKAMKKLGEDRILRERYSEKAISIVQDKYTMKVLDDNYRKLFEKLV